MSDKIFFIDILNDTESRYALSKFLRFTDNSDPITSKFIEDLKNINSGGTYRITGNEFRPDRISMEIYNNFQYWWIILLYNNILKIEDLVSGLVLSYPDINDLEDLYFSLKSQEISQ